MTIPPLGGAVGPGPFTDSSDDNNFWGTMIVNPGPDQTTIFGELTMPWAGAGGGAGGDSTQFSAIGAGYPDPSFPKNREDKGAGGGGGGGSITILSLGTISFGPSGRIEANGGTGAGGENTNFVNRIGGGSGGGSGGHIVLQSTRGIDFSTVPVPGTVCWETDFDCLSVMALGGQGGAGSLNTGGFDPDNVNSGNPGGPDAKPASFDAMGEPCAIVGPVDCAGGDGGPGIVQMHTPDLLDIVPPGGMVGDLVQPVANLPLVSRPSPIGLNDLTGLWEAQLLPAFGRVSRARSRWIPLGAMRVAPGTTVPDSIQFLFSGIDPVTGLVSTTADVVDSLPAIVSGALALPGTFPFVAPDGATVVFDVTDLAGANDIYRRNPSLTQLFQVEFDNGAGAQAIFPVEAAVADEVAGELRLTLGGSLSGLTPRRFWRRYDG